MNKERALELFKEFQEETLQAVIDFSKSANFSKKRLESLRLDINLLLSVIKQTLESNLEQQVSEESIMAAMVAVMDHPIIFIAMSCSESKKQTYIELMTRYATNVTMEIERKSAKDVIQR